VEGKAEPPVVVGGCVTVNMVGWRCGEEEEEEEEEEECTGGDDTMEEEEEEAVAATEEEEAAAAAEGEACASERPSVERRASRNRSRRSAATV
jgi:hypothetical protein